MTSDERREVLALGKDHRPRRGRVVLAVLLAALVALVGHRWTSGPGTPADAEDDPPPAGAPGWAGQLDSGDESRLAYAVGTTLHLGGRELDVHGPGVDATTVVLLRGQVPSGWLVSLASRDGGEQPSTQAHGLVDDSGGFVPWQVDGFLGLGTALTSPDGSQVLALVEGRARVLDTTFGTPVGTVPRGEPVAWTGDGVYLLRGTTRGTARVWDPASGMRPGAFDASACEGNLTAVAASIGAGWERCRRADLVATSPSGEHAVRTVTTANGPALVNQLGEPLIPPGRGVPGPALLQGLTPAQFLDEDTVILGLIERTGTGTVIAFVRCAVTAARCERAGDVVPADLAAADAFVVLPGCHDGDAPGARLTASRPR